MSHRGDHRTCPVSPNYAHLSLVKDSILEELVFLPPISFLAGIRLSGSFQLEVTVDEKTTASRTPRDIWTLLWSVP
ncbi:hypothetical protein PILCRDRAFT_830553 [Piloderma croceum F 1598]|uniref:Uncharacterized protein n=1 Tax=Piloderma croceum (strain F 1598) TaxID=765440 RepID=A0A0C3ESL4_PILCF|nr:hypothetical protein PILCRDRAFT_830553 [Piloderma croceum F 1598]